MSKIDSKNNKIKLLICLIIIIAITIVLILVLNKKKEDDPVIVEQGGTIIDNTEELSNTEYLPLIRLSIYDEETGNREGTVITSNGIIYNYAFNEYTVIYPDSDVFAINQTLYYNNKIEELGRVDSEDLTLLIGYCETIGNEYETDDIVFDTVGNSISVTNYNKEDVYVLINNEGVINKNDYTTKILDILNKYNISL